MLCLSFKPCFWDKHYPLRDRGSTRRPPGAPAFLTCPAASFAETRQPKQSGTPLRYDFFLYLDDLCLAGTSQAVAQAISTLQAEIRNLGLSVSEDNKCEVIPTAGSQHTVDRHAFPSTFKFITTQCFELLGAPIGTDQFCQQHTRERTNKATKLLSAIGALPDPQVALLLLRYCAGFSKLVYSSRIVPHHAHTDALRDFDLAVRLCFETFTNIDIDDNSWSQATLSTKQSGLGLRGTQQHCSAAALASRSSCYELCQQIDSNHTYDPTDATTPEGPALLVFNANVRAQDRIDLGICDALSQQKLSAAIDTHTFDDLTNPANTTPAHRAHLHLQTAGGAGSWLHALPSENLGLKVDAPLYTTMLQRWLRVPFAASDQFCPLCNGILDTHGDHALTCGCGGDRIKRHNLLRNAFFYLLRGASYNPEAEKPDLLRPRPIVGPAQEDGSPADTTHLDNSDDRRPADVYVPRWSSGIPAAFDFAVTSGLRDDALNDSASGDMSHLTRYEDFKMSYLSTKTQCEEEGMTFIPMVMDACGGGWGKQACKVWTKLAKSLALEAGEQSTTANLFLQRFALILHRENARALRRRFQRLSAPPPPPLPPPLSTEPLD